MHQTTIIFLWVALFSIKAVAQCSWYATNPVRWLLIFYELIRILNRILPLYQTFV